jgi:heme exporter protein CcmD
MKDYSFYITTAYIVCFVVLSGMIVSTLLARKKHK